MTISIISMFYNDKDMLRTVMNSVLSQSYTDVEHIVVDGGSTDGSVELMKEYEAKYEAAGKTFRWISEKDNGIYDAMNKGYNMATGDYFICASDPYYDTGSLAVIADEINSGNYDYLFGGIIFHNNGKITRRWTGRPGSWRLGWMAADPTFCFRKEVWKKHGPFDITHPSAADYKYQLKVLMDKSLTSRSIPRPLVVFYAGGSSNVGIKGNLNSIKEDLRTLKECGVRFGWFTEMCKIIRAFCGYTFASRKKIDLEVYK